MTASSYVPGSVPELGWGGDLGRVVSRVEGSTLKEKSSIKL